MKATFCYRRGLAHHRYWGEAFIAGLKRHGIQCDVAEVQIARPTELLILWGVRNRVAIRAQRNAGGHVCILERGYIGDRTLWTSVSFGGNLNGRAEFRGPLDNPERWKLLFHGYKKAWKKDAGEYALILGQVPSDAAVAGRNIVGWYNETANDLKRAGHKVMFRPHPLAQNVHVKNAKRLDDGSLQQALSKARLAVTWNSNSGVDAVLAGVPTIAADRGSMAWEVTSHDIVSAPFTGDRTVWANALAWKQWNEGEMRSGECWERVRLNDTVPA